MTSTSAAMGDMPLASGLSKFRKPPFPSDWSLSSLKDSELQSYVPGCSIPLFPATVNTFLRRELNVDKLNGLHQHLWFCGRRGHIHPLHWQKMMRRDIFVTEDANLHLVWYRNCIYIKPLPECLLHHSFFEIWLCREKAAYENACGLLLSYIRLVVHRSDFDIAKELGCFPPKLTWLEWSELWNHLNAERSRIPVNKRYLYGELRLSRLNLLSVLLFRGMAYHAIDRSYSSFFANNFAWLLALFAYQSIVVSCFQLLSVVDTQPWLYSVSRWVSGIILGAIGLIISIQTGTFLIVFLWNWSRAGKPIDEDAAYLGQVYMEPSMAG